MRHDRDSRSVRLRSTMAAVAVAAVTMGLTAAYDPSGAGHSTIVPVDPAPRSETRGGDCGPLVECASERECYDRIAACIDNGGDWRGDQSSGRCHFSSR